MRRRPPILLLALVLGCGRTDVVEGFGEDGRTDGFGTFDGGDDAGPGPEPEPQPEPAPEPRPEPNPVPDPVWEWIYDGEQGDDYGYALAMDGASVLVTGASEVSGSSLDALVARFTPPGEVEWMRKIGGPASEPDLAFGVARMSGGLVVSGGYTDVFEGGQRNAFVRRFAADGGTIWSRAHDGPVGELDTANGVAVDGDRVYVAGRYTAAPDDLQGWVRRYDDTGEVLWTVDVAGVAGGFDALTDVAVDGEGRVWAVGRRTDGQDADALLMAIDAQGTVSLATTLVGTGAGEDSFGAVVVHPDGGVVVAGSTDAGVAQQAWLVRYSGEGELLWVEVLPADSGAVDVALDLAVAPDGRFAVGGARTSDDGDRDAFIEVYDAGGALLWSTTRDGGVDGEDFASGVVLDGERVVVTGSLAREGTGQDLWLISYPLE